MPKKGKTKPESVGAGKLRIIPLGGRNEMGKNLTAIVLAVIFGLLVYIFPIILTETEKRGPYPLWMHTFYFAADFMGIWVFLDAWKATDHFILFLLLAIGEAVWVRSTGSPARRRVR